MVTLVTYKVSKATKFNNDIFINEFGNIFDDVISKCFSLYPLRGVISSNLDVLISYISCYRFDGPIKSNPHFINCLKAIIDLSDLSPLHHMGSNH
jgi:hypothetical protein